MTVQWEKVHVFISSTFSDMHAERDYLVKSVFPELSEWCEERKLRLVDIDLRWGVTEQDATQNKNVVKVCLERIDECRPFFLCFLGQRRGWVPVENDVSTETLQAYPDLKAYLGEASITEMEILHALISPLHQRISGTAKEYEPAEHSFFYLREPDFLEQLPKYTPEFFKIFTNAPTKETDQSPSEEAEQDLKLEEWREKIIPNQGRPVRKYTASWDPAARSPELAPKAAELDADLTAGRLVDFRTAGEDHPGMPLDEAILEDLKTAIATRLPDHVQILHETDLQRELDQQEQFLFASSEGFISRGNDFDELDRYVQGESKEVFVLKAPAGMGKTSLLANWISHSSATTTHPDQSIQYRFIGGSDRSTDIYSLILFLMRELDEIHNKLDAEIPENPQDLVDALYNLLEEAGSKGKTIIVLDAINQLDRGLADTRWIPWHLPKNVKLIISFKLEAEGAEKLFQRLRSQNHAFLSEVQPFDNMNDRRLLVETYLDQYLKELDEEQVDTLIRSPGAGNPLYLKVVLNELRVFGVFEDLSRKIQNDFGDTPVSAFHAVLNRLETDPAYTALDPAASVPLLFGLLAHARRGLSVSEITAIFINELNLDNNGEERKAVEETIYHYLRQVRPFLARRDGRFDYFYESFKIASQAQYTRSETADNLSKRDIEDWHILLAEYFSELPNWTKIDHDVERQANTRRVSELPYHQVLGKLGDQIVKTLTDFEFLTAKLYALDLQSLSFDYDVALEVDDYKFENEPIDYREQLIRIRDTLQLSSHILNNDKSQIAGQLLGRLLNDRSQLIARMLEDAKTWDYSPWLRPLRASLTPPGGALIKTLRESDTYGHVVAIRDDGKQVLSLNDESVITLWDFETGEEIFTFSGHKLSISSLTLKLGTCIAVAKNWKRMLTWTDDDYSFKLWDLERGEEIKTITVEQLIWAGFGNDVALSHDGQIAFLGSGKNVRAVNLGTLEIIYTLEGHSLDINKIVISDDGSCVATCSDDCTVKIWNLENGNELQTLTGHKESVLSAAVFDNSRRVISTSKDNTLKVWDIEAGKELHTLEGHFGSVNVVDIFHNERYAISGADDSMIRIWDTETGDQLSTMEGHTWCVRLLKVTPDGKQVISTADDPSLKVWDLRGAYVQKSVLLGHEDRVTSARVFANGRKAISCSDDNTLRIWDLEEFRTIHTLTGHSAPVTAVRLFDKDRRAISTSKDQTLKVWDIEAGVELLTLNGHTNDINAVTVTSDNSLAISGSEDNTIRVWDLISGEEIHNIQENSSPIKTIDLFDNDTKFISGSDTLRVWDFKTGKCISQLDGDTGLIIATTMNHEIFLSGSEDGTIKSWDLTDGRVTSTLQGHSNPVIQVEFLNNSNKVISAYDDSLIKVWNLETGKVVHNLVEQSFFVEAMSVSNDGKLAATAGADLDSIITIWDLEVGGALGMLEGHKDYITSLCFLPDGKHLISCSEDHSLRVWNLEMLGDLASTNPHSTEIENLKINPIADEVISISKNQVWNILITWDPDQSKAIDSRTVSKKELPPEIDSLEDGRQFSKTDEGLILNEGFEVIAQSGGNIILRERSTKNQISSFTADRDIKVYCLSPAGKTIFAGDDSGQVHILRIEGIEKEI